MSAEKAKTSTYFREIILNKNMSNAAEAEKMKRSEKVQIAKSLTSTERSCLCAPVHKSS